MSNLDLNNALTNSPSAQPSSAYEAEKAADPRDRYYGKDGAVWKAPIETRKEGGATTISIGFKVCTMTDVVGCEAADTVADLMNAGVAALSTAPTATSGEGGETEQALRHILDGIDKALNGNATIETPEDHVGWLASCLEGLRSRAQHALNSLSHPPAGQAPAGEAPTISPHDWTKGTGYEVWNPILEDNRSASLTATYTPSNGIKIRLEDYEDEDGKQSPENARNGPLWIEFHPSNEQARWLAGRLLAWADDNHGAAQLKAVGPVGEEALREAVADA